MFDKVIRALTALSVVVIVTAILTACGVATPTTATAPTIMPAPTIVPTVAPATSVDTADIDAYVAKMLETYDVPGAAIALVLPDGSTYTQGYGVRDTSAGTPVTADTQFAIASVTKSFTALGMMLLVDEGKVDLDAPVTDYLPEFRLSDPAMTPKVTVRHLLTHTTGMERNSSATGNPTITRDQVVALAAETPLVAAPGEKYVYSNVNTVTAGRIIEVVSGQSWEEFTRERIFAPLGMTSATLNTTAMQQQPNFALPHELDLVAGMVPSAFLEPYAEAPAAAVNASANEMLRYLQFQLGDGTAVGGRLLKPESLAELHRTQIAVDETGPVSRAALVAAEQGVAAPESLTGEYGYGLYWFTEQFQDRQVVQHDGQGVGFSASASFAPKEGVGVVVLTNGHYAFGFIETVRSYILEELLGIEHSRDLYQVVEAQLALVGRDQVTLAQPVEAVRSYTADPAQLEALAGTYTNLAAAEPATVTAVDGRALRLELLSPMGPLSLDLLPVAADTFLINTPPYRGLPVEFKADAEGTLVTLNGFEIARRPAQQ